MQVRLGECVEAFEEPQVVEELECAGVDGVAAEVPQVVSDVLTVLGVPFGTSHDVALSCRISPYGAMMWGWRPTEPPTRT